MKILTVQRRDATGVDILRGLCFFRTGAGAFETTIANKRELAEVLGDGFGLRVAPAHADAFDRLWVRTLDAHRAWDAAGRP